MVAILTDSLWRWKLDPQTAANNPYERFWDQGQISQVKRQVKFVIQGVG